MSNENRPWDDGVDRRGFLRCMAWAGTGLVWTAQSGVLSSRVLAAGRELSAPRATEFSFAQISDSHIGFAKEANGDVIGTLREALRRLKALPAAPAFIIHTGDLTHLSKPEEFDTLDQIVRGASLPEIFYLPGEHDVIGDDGRAFLARHGRGTVGRGWFSFDHKGVHVIGLVNVLDLKAGGLGRLGSDQLAWLEKDLRARSASTPIVVCAHIPLWSVYPEWGWGTDDGAQALGYVRRFGSVTVLNGHIHQTMQKIEGHVTFHTASSTAFPQPAPGAAQGPGPMTVPADRLRQVLGLSDVHFLARDQPLAIIDHRLDGTVGAGEATSAGSVTMTAAPSTITGSADVTIDQFTFSVPVLTVKPGRRVTWLNRDDAPHTVTSETKVFASGALDTGDRFVYTFDQVGVYPYYCSLHPHMTARVVVASDGDSIIRLT